MKEEILIVRNLLKTFGSQAAVQGISFSIARGEILGLLGPNGAGKTTTLSMLTGLIQPTGGQILMDGKDIQTQLSRTRARIGLVPQDLALYQTISARDNLIFWGQIYGLRGKKLQERIDQVLDIVQLTDRANQPVDTFSGGMKRRVNLAVGLLHQPEILFLDEPTVGVDPQSRNAIFESIESLNRAGLTIIYTTHYMEEAERLCHRVAIVDHGKIIALDTPANLIRNLNGGMIRLSIADGMIQRVKLEVEGLPSVTQVSQNDHQLDIQACDSQKTLIDILQITNRLDAQITALQVLDANLETVFLNLTGKNLRE
jgi:ABC-2 type transport system ATP-binding protein